jgi:hypothetical protein
MKSYVVALTTAISLVLGGACANKTANSGLVIGIANSSPSINPVPGSTTTVNGIIITAPYFVVNQMTLQWTGTGGLNILSLEFKTASNTSSSTDPNSQQPYDCILVGSPLLFAFPTGYFANAYALGQIVIPGVGFDNTSGSPVANPQLTTAPTVITSQIGCSAVPLPSPQPDSFRLPLIVKVTAEVVPDPVKTPSNQAGLVTATGTITPFY